MLINWVLNIFKCVNDAYKYLNTKYLSVYCTRACTHIQSTAKLLEVTIAAQLNESLPSSSYLSLDVRREKYTTNPEFCITLR